MWYLHIHFVCAISCFLCAIKITFPFLDSSLNNSILSERWFLCYKHLLHHPQSRWFPVSGIIIFRNTKNSNAFNWLKPESKKPQISWYYQKIHGLCFVPAAGLEPARCCHQWILSPPRLPFRQAGVTITALIILSQDFPFGKCFLWLLNWKERKYIVW